MRFLGVLNALLNSRKAVIAAAFLIGGGAILLGHENVSQELVISYLLACGYLVGEVIKAIRDEDVASKTAAGMVAAANVTADATAKTTTLTTPSENVNVQMSETPPPAVPPVPVQRQPFISSTGL